MPGLVKKRGVGGWAGVGPGGGVWPVPGQHKAVGGVVEQGALLQDVVVEPTIFSPNGDGINDGVSFRFKVVKVGDASPVEVLIHDLGGRLIRRLVEQRGVSTGTYGLSWDGRDERGAIVPPGVYMARLRVDTDTEGAAIKDEEILRTIALAY